MSNCTGYSFDTDLDLCTDGPVGNSNVANLSIYINVPGSNFITGTTTIPWNGEELVIDLITNPDISVNARFSAGFGTNSDSCAIAGAMLSLIPDGGDTNTGMAMLEITLNDCYGPTESINDTTPPNGTTTTTTPTTTSPPFQYIDTNCGASSFGDNTWILMEMIPFTLADGAACGIT